MLTLTLGFASFINNIILLIIIIKQQQLNFPFIQRSQPTGQNCMFLIKYLSMGLKHPVEKSLHIISSCPLSVSTRYSFVTEVLQLNISFAHLMYSYPACACTHTCAHLQVYTSQIQDFFWVVVSSSQSHLSSICVKTVTISLDKQ